MVRRSLTLAVAMAALGMVSAEEVGMTPEDACRGLSENDPCEVKDPNQYVEYGTCLWHAPATEAPYVTAAPNPAIEACEGENVEEGSACSFTDTESGAALTGTCTSSQTIVDYDGFICETGEDTETVETEACDSLKADDECTVSYGDGTSLTGVCFDTGGLYLKCEVNATAPKDDEGGTSESDTDITNPAQIACLLDADLPSEGYVLDGTSCSYVSETDGKTIQGTCHSKEGGAHSICESSDMGGGGDMPSDTGNPDVVACAGLSSLDPCVLLDPMTNANISGACEESPATGEIVCVPSDVIDNQGRQLSPIYLYCHVTSGGGDTTDALPTTVDTDYGGEVSFEDNAGAVAGGVIGGLLIVAGLVVGGIFVYRKYGQRRLDVDIDTEGADVYQTL